MGQEAADICSAQTDSQPCRVKPDWMLVIRVIGRGLCHAWHVLRINQRETAVNVNSKTPMALYKANLELVLRIGALLQENRRRWSKAGTTGASEAIERTLAETQRMLTTNDWTSLSAMPGEEFWKSLSSGGAPLQGTVESAIRSQTEFAQGLKDAFAEWQQQSAEALGGNPAQAAPWAFGDLMQAFSNTHGAGKPTPAQSPAAAPRPTAKAKPEKAPKKAAAKSTKAKADRTAKLKSRPPSAKAKRATATRKRAGK
jgi:hypothetical protein